MPSWSVRKLEEEDLAQYLAFEDEYDFLQSGVDRETRYEALVDQVAGDRVTTYVAEEDGAFVGTGTTIEEQGRRHLAGGFVRPADRARRVDGTSIYRDLVDARLGDADGCDAVSTNATTSHAAVQHVMETEGFAPVAAAYWVEGLDIAMYRADSRVAFEGDTVHVPEQAVPAARHALDVAGDGADAYTVETEGVAGAVAVETGRDRAWWYVRDGDEMAADAAADGLLAAVADDPDEERLARLDAHSPATPAVAEQLADAGFRYGGLHPDAEKEQWELLLHYRPTPVDVAATDATERLLGLLDTPYTVAARDEPVDGAHRLEIKGNGR